MDLWLKYFCDAWTVVGTLLCILLAFPTWTSVEVANRKKKGKGKAMLICFLYLVAMALSIASVSVASHVFRDMKYIL